MERASPLYLLHSFDIRYIHLLHTSRLLLQAPLRERGHEHHSGNPTTHHGVTLATAAAVTVAEMAAAAGQLRFHHIELHHLGLHHLVFGLALCTGSIVFCTDVFVFCTESVIHPLAYTVT